MKKLRVALYFLLGGVVVAIPALSAGHFGWYWISGIVLAASFVPVALFGPRKFLRQLGVVLPVLWIVTIFCTWTEGLVFVEEIRQHMFRNLAGGLAFYTIVGVALAALAVGLKLPREASAAAEVRSGPMIVLMVAVCGIAYVVYYYVFGGITYFYFTKAYYSAVVPDVTRLGWWFPLMQFGRGVLMTLAVLPVIYALRVSRKQAAIAVGLLIWVAGGLAPLLMPNPYMGARQRFIHIIEIFTQNTSLGITAVLLLRRKHGIDAPEAIAGVTTAD